MPCQRKLLALLLNQKQRSPSGKREDTEKNCLLVVVAFASPSEFYVYSSFTYLNRNHYFSVPSFGTFKKGIFSSEAKDVLLNSPARILKRLNTVTPRHTARTWPPNE